ncbi:MAG: hypothetical protein QM778_30530 [Myxococcales bacterium]
MLALRFHDRAARRYDRAWFAGVLRMAAPVVLVGMLTMLAGGVAHARDRRPLSEAIRVQAGATCVQTESLVPQVEAWLRSDRVDADLGVDVIGSPQDPRDVTMEIRRGATILGKRRFQPAPFVCTQLEASLAVAIAMGLKASLRDELLSDLGATGSTDKQGASLLARVGFGLLPRVSLGAGLAGSRALGTRFGLRAEGFADAAGAAGFDTAPGVFRSLLLSGQLSACALFPIAGSLSARACLGLAIGALQARGQGYKESHSEWLAWLAASNSLALSVRVSGPWWLELPASLVVPLNKVSFGVESEAGTLAGMRTLPRLGFTLGAGPSYHF